MLGRLPTASLRPMPSCITTSSPRAAGKRPTRKSCAAGSASKRCSRSAGRSSSSMAIRGSDQTYLPRASTSRFSAKWCQDQAKCPQEPQGRWGSNTPRSSGSCHIENMCQDFSGGRIKLVRLCARFDSEAI